MDLDERARVLPLPAFYKTENSHSSSYDPEQAALLEAAFEWRQKHRICAAADDRKKIHLLLIDMQRDFCFPDGALYVGGRSGRGALHDNDRVARFIYRNLTVLTEVTCTLDTHFPYQIFSSSFWSSTDGKPLRAHREISTEQIRSGLVKPNPAICGWLCDGDLVWLQDQVLDYCERLEEAGRYRLYLWPPHCMLGSRGHALAGTVHEARLFHAWVRGSRDTIETKGGHSLTENYSVFAPEVLLSHDEKPLARRNTGFLDRLLDADAIIVAGQAASHCVKSSVEDLLSEIRTRDSALTQKVYLLRDCMSSVAVPDPEDPGAFLFDFTEQAEEGLRGFEAAGMRVVSSTTPMSEWPGC